MRKLAIKIGAAIILTVVVLIIPARAGLLEDAVAAYKRGDYGKTLLLLRPLAEQDNAIAQYNLGQMYREGQGVPQDSAEAAKWYRKAADQGHAGAQGNLGSFYYRGQGVPQDFTEAAKWYRKAAEQGNTIVYRFLGLFRRYLPGNHSRLYPGTSQIPAQA